MDFYISWSHSDPHYQMYDNDCHMLISPHNITGVWQLKRFSHLPTKVLLDSGCYSYIANNLPLPTPKETFKRQLFITQDTDLPTTICAMDIPILRKDATLGERDRAIDKTIANAWELKLLITEYSKSLSNSKPREYPIEAMAIIQGFDITSLKYCARRLMEIGYTSFGIGSMAHLYDTNEIVRRIEAVQSVIGQTVHIFGVSAIETLKEFKGLQVGSIDSTRPIKAAIYNEILYSDPYFRVGIAGSRFRLDNRKFSEGKLVSHLSIKCPCPICMGEVNNDILVTGKRKNLLMRAVHNYYHVKKMICG